MALLQLLAEEGKFYVMRITTKFLKELRSFSEDGSEDKIIHIDYNRWTKANRCKGSYSFDLRMVRIELSSGESELLITNLREDEFSRKQIGKLYGMRWGIESSFNELKNSLFIENFISKKENSIRQEFYASLIVYNLSKSLVNMMEAEMNEHLGYESHERSDSENARNGKKIKSLRSSYGEVDVAVPQDRESSFDPMIVKKRQKKISDYRSKNNQYVCERLIDTANIRASARHLWL